MDVHREMGDRFVRFFPIFLGEICFTNSHGYTERANWYAFRVCSFSINNDFFWIDDINQDEIIEFDGGDNYGHGIVDWSWYDFIIARNQGKIKPLQLEGALFLSWSALIPQHRLNGIR